MRPLTRRRWLSLLPGLAAGASLGGRAMGAHGQALLPATPVTHGRKHHFFGYYDKHPWDATGRYLLGLEVDFVGRQSEPDERARIGMTDLATGEFVVLDETHAWNWQQGTMLQWLETAPDRLVIYNTRSVDRFGANILDVHTGAKRELPRPVYALSRDGTQAVTLNFARVHRTRPGYGYDGLPDPWADDPAPGEDGVYHLDLATGDSRLIISLQDIIGFAPLADMEGAEHWFNHLQFCTDDSRFVFLHRWRTATAAGWRTRMLTAAPDGADIHCVADHDMVSHFDWRDANHILAWAREPETGDHYHLYTDQSDECTSIGAGVLDCDGHCSYSPDRQWILTDTYPDRERNRTLLLYHAATGDRFDIGRFYSPPDLDGPWRCDLHPRWSRDGRKVCIDSAHEETRQMYMIDVSPVVE